jgi:hypothetical protein
MKDKQIWQDFYQAAIEFRDLKPWEWMYDSELFGIQDPQSGETNYCCIMGNAGEHYAMGLYLGDEGLKSYLLLSNLADQVPSADIKAIIYNQLMLKVEFTSRENITENELKIFKELGLKFRGKQAWVAGRYFSPDRPDYPLDASQALILTHALRQAALVCERVKNDKDLLYGPEEEMLVRIPEQQEEALSWSERFEKPKTYHFHPFPSIKPSAKRVKKAKEKLEQKDAAMLLMFQYMGTPVLDESKQMVIPRMAIWLSYPEAMVIGNEVIMPDRSMEDLEDAFFELIHHLELIPKQIGFNSVMGYRAFLELTDALEIEALLIPDDPLFAEVEQSLQQFF